MTRRVVLIFLGIAIIAIANAIDNVQVLPRVNKDPYRLEHLLKVAARHCQEISNATQVKERKIVWDKCMSVAKVCIATEEICDDLDKTGFIRGARISCKAKRLDCYKNVKKQIEKLVKNSSKENRMVVEKA